MSVSSLLADNSDKSWSNLFINSLKVYNDLTVCGNILVEGDAEFVGNVQFDSFDIDNINAGPPDTFLSTNGASQVVWEPISAAPDTIYTDDGTLTGNREIAGDGNNLTFTNLSDYTVINTGNTTINTTGTTTIGANELDINADVSITPTPSTDNLVPQVLSIEPVTNKFRMVDISTLSSSPARNIIVAQSGGDYDNLADAVTAANGLTPASGNNVNIYVYPGTYDIVGTLTVSKFIKLIGIGKPTITRTSGAATDILDLNDDIENFILSSSVNTGNFITFSGFGNIKDCTFICSGMDYVVESNFGIGMYNVVFSNAAGSNTAFGRFNGAAFDYTFNNVSFVSLNLQRGFDCITGRYYFSNCKYRLDNLTPCLDIDTTREVFISTCDFYDGTSGNIALDISNGDVSIIGCNFINNLGTQINATGGDILTNACNLNETLINGIDLLKGSFQSTRIDEPSIKVLNELNIGSPTVGRGLVSGFGDSYPIPIAKTCTATGPADNGSTFNDITADLFENDGTSVPLFAATTANRSLLIGSPIATFSGIKIEITTALVLGAGSILIEYYSSGSGQFEPLRLMSTEADGNYNSRANTLFEIGTYQYRTNLDISDMALVNIDGLEAYYIRFRITSNITTIPQGDYIKIHSPYRFQCNENSFCQVFNDFNTRNRQLSLNTGVLSGGTPSTQTYYLSSSLKVDALENGLPATSDTFYSYVFNIPNNIDSSKDLSFILSFFTGNGNSGDVIFNYEAAYLRTDTDDPSDLSSIYTTSGSAPATSAGDLTGGVVSETFSYALGEDDKLKFLKIDLDVSPLICRRNNGSTCSDLLILRIGREGANVNDTFPASIFLVDFQMQYNIWYI